MTTFETSLQWHNRANRIIPGGVSSPVRAFQSVGGTPRYFVRGEGSKVWDVNGNEYVDLVGSWGPMIVGHAHPHVVNRVKSAMEKSFSFGAPGPGEVLLAEEIAARVPACERVRFVSSGTEAVMTAVRLARAATSRNLIVKFAGCYHGHSDSLLVQSGSGIATLGLPNSPGVTPGQTQDTIVVPYNDIEAVTQLFAVRGFEIAAVITEATPANMGVVPPLPGFNKFLADITKKHGALFILDEVMTGFRISQGGWWGKFGAEENWTPDLFTFGKVIGGGMPLAAVGGSAAVMELLAPSGSVYQAGTLSGNPVATAAGLATLELCDSDLYVTLDSRAGEVGSSISEALTAAHVEHSFQQAGNLFSFFFTPHIVNNFDDAKVQDTSAFAVFFHSLLKQGISVPPSAFEAWFVSGALTDDDVDKIAKAATVAAQQVKLHSS
ncbi:glutamate-1-semialdehyde 2,1-aminomutase [Aurantimicrobium minutum]|uniref:glutamate-1-semialdehyde 2,1-aminomutase n=1 Tax=Aurantimicrobium minutum TaxID=708131 RepID=UPI002405765D|nr:glutamate-1-semialdehyde 2,1-aminomutase [Aurantimicrobium minutum]MDF9809800.1 glutamate-1-semialdehyde 2,1-aminomutase [Aurantimicrobium minutum]